jgi:putative FmdB family regulatory protein
MPTYDYVCEACGHEFEHFQSMSDKRLRTCPACKKPALVRRVGAGAGVIFKGSGFYQTDYKNAGGSKASSSGSDSSSKGEGKPDSSAGGGCGKPECGTTPGTCASDGAKTPAKAPSPKKKGD